MAGNRQVVREDVVRVSFDVADNPFQDIIDDLNEVKKTTEKTVGGAEKEFQDLGKAGKDASKGFTDIANEAKKLGGVMNSIDKDISSFNNRMKQAKNKFDSFKTSLKNIAIHPLKNTANTLRQIKDRLTEGQKGVKGFTTGLKNAGKVGFEKLVSGVNKVKEGLTNVKNKLKDVTKTGFTKLVSGLKSVENKLSDIAKKAGTTAFNALKKIAGMTFKATIAGLGATAAAIGGIVTKSVQSFADYEQLVGGVDTLFKDSSGIVQKNAAKAFETAGLSANAYMETVTSFSASLLQSLGGDTKKAASVADKALVDMSDNANKMGTSMESIQNAYQGFAKQNYTMLDNLKLGYGGTKQEMERLLKDAGKLAGKTFKMSSYADVIEAIHVIQDEMGITGTTAKEASTTIQGSLSAMKGAWQNVLTALVTGKDFDKVVDQLVDTVKTFAGNIIPAIKSALGGVGKLVEELAPIIEKELPGLVEDLLPPLIKATVSLFAGLIKALPNIVKTFAKQIPDILKTLGDTISETFGKKFPIIDKVGDFFENAGKSAKNNISSVAKFIGVIIGLIGAFKLLKGISSITSMFGKSKGSGGIFSGLTDMFKEIATAKTTIILKGMANIAIILAGFTAMAAAFAFVAPFIAKLATGKELIEVISIMATLGVLGAVMAKFAGIVGLIPIPVVVKGLAGIAIVLAGFTAIVAAFGALSSIKGFNEFMTKGGDALANLMGQLGKIAGAIIGGIGEGLSKSLPAIATNISEFAKNLKPMFDTFSGIGDMGNIATFFKSLGSFFLMMTTNDILSFFTGGLDLAGLAKELTTFGAKAQGFFTKVAEYPDKGFSNAKKLFSSLAGVKGLPKEGGIFGWFTGKVNYESLATGLGKLASKNVVKFFNTVATLKTESFAIASQLFDCLASMKSLPKEGGIVGWFTGNVNYEDIASGLGALSKEGVKSFFDMVSGFNKKTFENTKSLFDSLAGIGNLPESGGFMSWLKGDVSLGDIADDLSSFSSKTSGFFEQINGVNIKNLNGLWDSLKKSEEVTTKITKIVDEKINVLVEKIKELPKKMGDGLKSTGSALANAMVEIWRQAVVASAKPVNKLISGANWIMKEFGSNKRVASWTPYAKGTDGHKGGNALVNDGRGAELVQMPNGNSFIPQGKNVFIPNAPKGMKVLPAEKTAQVMGRKSPTYHYANGTGNFDIWDYMDNPAGLISTMVSKKVDYSGTSGLSYHIGKGMVDTISGQMTNWAKKLFDEFGIGKDWLWPSISRAISSRFGYRSDPLGRGSRFHSAVDIPAPHGSPVYASKGGKVTRAGWATGYGNLVEIDHGQGWVTRYGHNSSLLVSAGQRVRQKQTIALVGSTGWSTGPHIHFEMRKNGVAVNPLSYATGFANGGIATKPSIFGEAGAEMAIPLSKDKRKRGIELWAETGNILGVYNPESSILPSYTPESSYTTTSNSRTENNTYSPTFVLNMNGASATDSNKRKVKKWIKESLNEAFDSIGRSNPELIEV